MTIADELAKLAELREQNVLTDAQFERAKARLLDEVAIEPDDEDHSEDPAPVAPTGSQPPSLSESAPSVVKRRLPAAEDASHQASKTKSGWKWAVIAGLILSAVAVAALVVLVTTNKSTSDHQAFCQRYKDALTLAYTDNPTATITTAGLSKQDAASVRKDEFAFQQAVHEITPAYNLPGLGTVPASPTYDPQTLRADFDAYIAKTIPNIMAQRRC